MIYIAFIKFQAHRNFEHIHHNKKIFVLFAITINVIKKKP